MKPTIVAPVLLVALLTSCRTLESSGESHRQTRDYLVTATKPDKLFVIDPATQSVISEFHIPDPSNSVGMIVPSPDGSVAYVLVNRMESIVGIDLATGRPVFRANLSSPGVRVKAMFAFDVTPDGRELIVYELPTRLGQSEYEVEEPRFAIFRTDAGLDAQPVRQFPAPRRVHMLFAKKDGTSFYAIGFNLYEYDRETGQLVSQQGIRDWQRPDYSNPDLLAVWPVTEPTGVFSSPVYSVLSAPGGPEGGVGKTSLMTLDLNTGKLAYHDFEETAAVIFTTVMSPTRAEAFGVYTQLSKIDTASSTLAKRIDLDHTFYVVNISTDGREVYLGGAMCDVAIYDAATLVKKGNVRLPGCGDQVLATLRVIRR